MSDKIQPAAEIAAAERQAASETTAQLQGKSKAEILALANGYQEQYGSILATRDNAEKLSAFSLLDLLHSVYPDASHPKKMQLASEIATRIETEMGKPADVPQSELIAASKRRDVAVRELAKHLTDEEIETLDKQARERIAELPENYDADEYTSKENARANRRRWLAEWIAKGILDYPIESKAA
ncbi:MAG: hypothetical protein PHZ00_08185 [Candidatus Peribacteraceae bacterium]|nr:hypothetical protein [Candidatus Peribacteraceae bacterium]